MRSVLSGVRRLLLPSWLGHFAFARGLLTDESLGIDSFEVFKSRRRALLSIPKEDLWKRIDHYNRPDNHLVIFTEDLKMALAFAETPNEVEKVVSLSENYQNQSERIGFNRFPYGPVLLRVMRAAKMPHEAFRLMVSNKPGFDYLACYQLAMDMCFEAGLYQNVVDLWQHFNQHSEFLKKDMPQPRTFQILVAAALYKMGTKEAFDVALECMNKFRQKSFIHNKTKHFMVGLALKLNDYDMAFELLSMEHSRGTAASNSLSVTVLANLNRVPEAMAHLTRILQTDLPEFESTSRQISMEAMDALSEAVQKSGNQEWQETFKRLQRFLRAGGHLVDISLDDLLCAPIASRQTSPEMVEQLALAGQANFIPAGDWTDETMSKLQYSDNSTELSSVENFRKTEARQRRKTALLDAVAEHVRAEGPFHVEETS